MLKALFLFFLMIQAQSKVLVISDMDDTLKQSNSMNSVSTVWYFLKGRNYGVMDNIFRDLKSHYGSLGKEVDFVYLSAAYDITVDQEKWLGEHGYPKGKTYLRKVFDKNVYDFKFSTMKKVIKKDYDKVYFFGDNSDKDPIVYRDIVEELKLNANIYIRDVSTRATSWDDEWTILQIIGVDYFFTEMDLLEYGIVKKISSETESEIKKLYSEKELLPYYTLRTLEKRIRLYYCPLDEKWYCPNYAKKRSQELIEDYYSRY